MNIDTMSILIVDDEPPNVALLQRTLERVGISRLYGITDSTRVEELLDKVNPDLILLDLHMPKRDGFDVLKALSERLSPEDYLPVLVLTADVSPQAKHKALSLGAKDFLHKPFDLLEVALRVRRLLETRQFHLQLREQNAHLEAAVRERTQELQEAHIDVLKRLARAAEYRDDETGEHVQRVAENATKIAQTLGLDDPLTQLIHQTAPLHDIGKIAIPDSILRKPGRLTAEEFEVIKTHTVVGSTLLANGKSRYLETAMRIARSHHERWNGNGYPDGLVGDTIPLEARIVAVVDVFDALTSKRPYKDPWPLPQAILEIERQSGLQFDPQVVRAFKQHAQRGDLAVEGTLVNQG